MPILYKTTNTNNGRYYIGVHVGSDDEYLGSGLALVRAIKKHGKEHFVRETISEHASMEDAYEAEREAITEAMLSDSKCYNINVGGHGGFYAANKAVWSPERKQAHVAKTTQAREATRAANPELWENQGRRCSDFYKNNPDKGRERGKKIAAYYVENPGAILAAAEKRAKYWAEHPAEFQAKTDAARAGLHKNPAIIAERNKLISASRVGGKWITNGSESSYLRADQPLPDGWKYGRK